MTVKYPPARFCKVCGAMYYVGTYSTHKKHGSHQWALKLGGVGK